MNTLSSKLALRIARIAAPILACALLLPGCFFPRSADYPHRTYRITGAVVRNLTDGTPYTFDYGNTRLDPDAGSTVEYFSFSEGAESPETEVNLHAAFRAYLKHQLEARAREIPPDERFVEAFGSGIEWCLLRSPMVAQTSTGQLEGDWTLPEWFQAEDEGLPFCVDTAMPAECRTEPGTTPVLQFTPRPLILPDLAVGLDSGPVAITLTNEGTGTLCLNTGRVLSGDTSDFTLQPGNPADATSCVPHNARPEEMRADRVLLGHGDFCTLNVTFHPTRPGLRRATLPVTSNDPTPGRERIDLFGHGVGGFLRVSAADGPASVIDRGGPGATARVCVPPGLGVYLEVQNCGPGIVTLDSASPVETTLSDFLIRAEAGGLSPAPGGDTFPVVLGSHQTFRFAATPTGGAATLGPLSLAGTERDSPFRVEFSTDAICPASPPDPGCP